jgi:hypothetical protein
MRVPRHLIGLFVIALAAALPATAPLAEDTAGVAPDDQLTLVVGTRFVKPAPAAASAKAQCSEARISTDDFNDTDHCLDQGALEVAKEYFITLGRTLGKAGFFYYVPEPEIKKLIAMCTRLHRSPPKAWVEAETEIIAFGKVVPDADAPKLERAIR